MKKILIVLITSFSISGFSQQDPQYSLYQFNQMAINPAYAGARDALAFVIDTRKQWVSFPGAPTTSAFTAHSPIMNGKLGLGFNFMNDRIGAKNVNAAYANFAYIAKLNNKYKLSFGLRAGYANYRFNYQDNLTIKDNADYVLNDLANANRGALDMDAGMFLKSNSFFMGFSATHINGGNIYKGNASGNGITYELKTHTFFIVGKSFVVNENFLITPTILVKRNWGKTMADLNLNCFISKRLWAGIFFKERYGSGILLQFYATNKLRIGYSFDTGRRDKRNLGSSHEIMIGYDIHPNKNKMISPRFL